ncbi:hypothetical protein EBR25_14150, partial [bacterium]|nr:hypothetical protein [bacterium]
PEENYYEDDGFVETLTPEELQNRYNSLNASDMQAGSMTVKDGKFVYLDAQGNEVSGIKQREKNPFDPGLEPADFSGFTHFRKRDDGKFDDKTEVTEFVKNSIEENEKHRTQALRHYAKEKGLEESVVMENPDQYIQSATDMWINEALDAWNQSKPTSTASEGDKRAAREAAAEEEARQNLYDSVRVIDRPVPRDEFETILEGALPMPTTVQETVREVVIPINRIKGSMNVTLEDGEMGQFRPQEIRAVNGILQVSGAYSFDRIQEGKSVQGIESRTITLDPNNISHVGQIQQLEKLGLDELNGVSLNQIINDPESIGIEAQQWSPNDI